jgi:hypothetical protein
MAGQRQKNGTAEGFQTFATKVSCWTGSRWSFLGAMLIIIVWAVLGPYFHYSDTWQLVVNTATTIVTFLMVFLTKYPEPGCPSHSSETRRDHPFHSTSAQ